MIGYLLVEVVLAVMFFESLTQWKWDQQLISHHLDNTSFDVIEDKEDLYRHERYILFCPFQESLHVWHCILCQLGKYPLFHTPDVFL
jgi:hypothetical protein